MFFFKIIISMSSCSANAAHVCDGESLLVFLTCVSVWEHHREWKDGGLGSREPEFHSPKPPFVSCEGHVC